MHHMLLTKFTNPVLTEESQFYTALSLNMMQFLGLHRGLSQHLPLTLYDLYMINADGQLTEIAKLGKMK